MVNNWTIAAQEYERRLSEPPKSDVELWEEYQEKQDYLEAKGDAEFEESRLEELGNAR